ncbi:hypothetical protein [Virgibacillus salexigens]|uniref:Uncharacterized protein n=1 Tax=Virgibacillus massiliensis TaxID=1462526 RepID=A0A024QI10_9BACI|nr:hypothetical protein [Virgibacillus massiliensis]CDQ41877.1 hypothetical protein BN990_04256 [Virgibacillus massiliensis]
MSSLEFDKEKEQQPTFGTNLDQEEPKEPEQAEIPEEEPEKKPKENLEENGQFSLFEEPKQEKKAPKKPSTAPKKKSKPSQKVGMEYTVYYAGHQVPVPEEDMTMDTVRSYLETDFPELSKDRTEMLIDEKNKQIVPVVKGAKKG